MALPHWRQRTSVAAAGKCDVDVEIGLDRLGTGVADHADYIVPSAAHATLVEEINERRHGRHQHDGQYRERHHQLDERESQFRSCVRQAHASALVFPVGNLGGRGEDSKPEGMGGGMGRMNDADAADRGDYRCYYRHGILGETRR